MRSLSWEDYNHRLSSREMKYLLSEYEIDLRTKSDVPLSLSTQEKLLSPGNTRWSISGHNILRLKCRKKNGWSTSRMCTGLET